MSSHTGMSSCYMAFLEFQWENNASSGRQGFQTLQIHTQKNRHKWFLLGNLHLNANRAVSHSGKPQSFKVQVFSHLSTHMHIHICTHIHTHIHAHTHTYTHQTNTFFQNKQQFTNAILNDSIGTASIINDRSKS